MINTQIAENVYYNSINSQKSNANFVMGYALNLCKSYIYNVPYNHNIAEEGMEMTQNRVRIVDVADTLGLSTTTVSKVIHGKTEKISDKTVKRVQQELERSGYIPNMAGILLAGNNSRIIGVVVKTTSDIQLIGFDDNMASMESNPSLTTIHQEASLRAKAAIECLEAMHDGAKYKTEIVLPVDLMKRESTRKL